jgi:HEPN domain-containing protein
MAELMLESARRDAAAYFALMQHAGIHDSILGFHAQQVVEKALKSALFARGLFVPKTHNLAQLLDALADAAVAPPPHASELDTLNPYAVQARYGTLDVGALDRDAVGLWLTEILDWAAAQPAV